MPMPVDRKAIEESLARVNATRPKDLPATLESFEENRFVLSYPDRAMPDGQCIDQDFSDIQWDLHEHRKVFTNIVGGRQDESSGRYVMEYEVVEWD